MTRWRWGGHTPKSSAVMAGKVGSSGFRLSSGSTKIVWGPNLSTLQSRAHRRTASDDLLIHRGPAPLLAQTGKKCPVWAGNCTGT